VVWFKWFKYSWHLRLKSLLSYLCITYFPSKRLFCQFISIIRITIIRITLNVNTFCTPEFINKTEFHAPQIIRPIIQSSSTSPSAGSPMSSSSTQTQVLERSGDTVITHMSPMPMLSQSPVSTQNQVSSQSPAYSSQNHFYSSRNPVAYQHKLMPFLYPSSQSQNSFSQNLIPLSSNNHRFMNNASQSYPTYFQQKGETREISLDLNNSQICEMKKIHKENLNNGLKYAIISQIFIPDRLDKINDLLKAMHKMPNLRAYLHARPEGPNTAQNVMFIDSNQNESTNIEFPYSAQNFLNLPKDNLTPRS